MKYAALFLYHVVLLGAAVVGCKYIYSVDARCSSDMMQVMTRTPWQSLSTGAMLWHDGYLCDPKSGDCPKRIEQLKQQIELMQKQEANKKAEEEKHD